MSDTVTLTPEQIAARFSELEAAQRREAARVRTLEAEKRQGFEQETDAATFRVQLEEQQDRKFLESRERARLRAEAREDALHVTARERGTLEGELVKLADERARRLDALERERADFTADVGQREQAVRDRLSALRERVEAMADDAVRGKPIEVKMPPRGPGIDWGPLSIDTRPATLQPRRGGKLREVLAGAR